LAIDVHSVDWRNVAVPGAACLSSTAITLVNGQALIPDSQHGHPSQPGGTGPSYDKLSEVGSPTFGDFEGPAAPANPDDAAVSLDCDNNGGTAGGALLYSVGLYSVRSGTAKSVGLITPHQQPTGVLPTIIENVTMVPGTITVTEDWYGANDPTCCPTGRATSTWSYAASQLTYGSTRVTAQPH
jgi:hypothetical protein